MAHLKQCPQEDRFGALVTTCPFPDAFDLVSGQLQIVKLGDFKSPRKLVFEDGSF